jgi:uncharacterized protein YaeQ
VLAYGGRAVELWWDANKEKLMRQERLAISEVPLEASQSLSRMAGRAMQLQVTIQEGHVFFSDGAMSVPVELRVRKTLSSPRS